MFFILHETNPETLCMTHVHVKIYINLYYSIRTLLSSTH